MKRYDELEKIYVHDIYEKISKEFDITRTYHWSAVKNLLRLDTNEAERRV